jgi:hypothetical protein
VGVLLYSGRNINSGSRKEVYHEDLIEEEELPGGWKEASFTNVPVCTYM